MCARIMNLKTAGLKAINLYNSTLGRRLAPLRLRGHLKYQYQGLNVPTRLNATEWDEAEYTFNNVANHLPPLPGQEPEELKEEDDKAAGEDEDNEVMESDSEATAMDPAGRARGQKRSKPKVLKKSVPMRGAAATKAAEAKKAAEAEVAKVADAKKDAEVEAAKAADTKTIPSKEKVVPTEEGAATGARAEEEETAKTTGPSSAPTGAAQQTASRERRSKRAANPARTRGPPPSEMDETAAAGKEASTDTTARVSQGAAANPVLVEEEVDQAGAHPLPSYSFVELHRALGILHKRELEEATTEIQRLNAEVAEAAKKNHLLITAGKEREKVLAQARVGYVLESEVTAKLQEAEGKARKAASEAKRAMFEVAELTEVLDGKSKELEAIIEAKKRDLAVLAEAKDAELTMMANSHAAALDALKKEHADQLTTERATSNGVIVDLQKEKAEFENFIRENCCQILGVEDFVKATSARECMRATTTCILKSAADILATLQYLSPRERLQHDAQSVFEAISDIPMVVD
ncbi:hypothetical protein ACQ4PT_063356 [Festuca glaucescens]